MIRKLPLHLKTALLASAVSFVVLGSGLIVISASIARQIQENEKEIVRLQVENIAEQLSADSESFDDKDLKNLTNFLSGSRPNLVTVRIWRIEDGRFVERVSSDDSLPVDDLSPEFANALEAGSDISEVRRLTGSNDSYFRVLARIAIKGRAIGAVEGVEKLDTMATITWRYVTDLSLITLATFLLLSGSIYLMFRRLVYRPLERLLITMERAESAPSEVRPEDEALAGFSDRFAIVTRKLRELATERLRQNEILKRRVDEATAELTRKNEQLESANQQLFRTSRQMSEMERLAAAGQIAAQFAHEIGTPLNLISGHLQLLRSGLPAGSAELERLNTVDLQIERIERSVREMLDETRFGAADLGPVDLNEIVRSVAKAVEPTLDGAHVDLRLDLDPALPPIKGSSDRLVQVLFNLFKNSLDAVGDKGTIRIGTRSAERLAELTFADDGTGMDEETLERIFNPMFTTKSRGRGTGLGLFVVRQILKEHGADVSVESRPGAGTTFKIRFARI